MPKLIDAERVLRRLRRQKHGAWERERVAIDWAIRIVREEMEREEQGGD